MVDSTTNRLKRLGRRLGKHGLAAGAAAATMATSASARQTVLLQVDSTSTALCEAGVGGLATVGLFLGAIYLAYLAIPDLIKFFAGRNSSKSSSQSSSNEGLKGAGMKLFGAVIVAALPSILAGAGFALLECVDAVNVFSAAILPIWV